MTTQDKTLIFKGIDSKIEAVLRSFLDLAKSELQYQINIIEDETEVTDVDLVIKDEAYNLLAEEQALSELPSIIVGTNHHQQQQNYLVWPVQWSEFKLALQAVSMDSSAMEDEFSDMSVLVLETDSRDLWLVDDFDLAPEKNSQTALEIVAHQSEKPLVEPAPKIKRRPDDTTLVEMDDEFYLEAIELLADGASLMYIQPDAQSVYSAVSPTNWIHSLQTCRLAKRPLPVDWQAPADLQCYPMQRLIWVTTLINQSVDLHDNLQEDTRYTLEQWPEFDLLERDNVLLRLCAMLFTSAESVASLATKSGYGRSSIVGLINACYQQGCLKVVPSNN